MFLLSGCAPTDGMRARPVANPSQTTPPIHKTISGRSDTTTSGRVGQYPPRGPVGALNAHAYCRVFFSVTPGGQAGRGTRYSRASRQARRLEASRTPPHMWARDRLRGQALPRRRRPWPCHDRQPISFRTAIASLLDQFSAVFITNTALSRSPPEFLRVQVLAVGAFASSTDVHRAPFS
jgi:hypothetical protein